MDEWPEVFRQRMREAKPGDAWSLRTDEHLDGHSLEPGWEKAVQEHARASFRCSQCYHTWSSYQVVILFHMYWERSLRQGQVLMRLFRQQCHGCPSAQKEKPQFTREEMESILQRLVLDIRKKCYGERVHCRELLEVVCEGKGPHKSESCEACQMGLHKGRQGRPDDALHHGKRDGALHHGKRDGALHHGKRDGALHHGKPDGALYHVKADGALHHGKPSSALYPCTPNLPSYEISPIHTSSRRSHIQPPSSSAAPTSSCPCSICCIVISAVVIFVLVAYWNGWF